MSMNSEHISAPSGVEGPLSEREQRLLKLRQKITLTLGGMAAPIIHDRDNGTTLIAIREKAEGTKETFDDFEAHYKELGALLEELRKLREV